MNKEHPLELFTHCPKCGSNRFTVNDEKSKHCADCGFTYYANPASATAAFIVRDGCLLVARRAKEPARGTLDLPGGFADMYEDAEQGIIREIKEETGLDVTATPVYLFSIPNRYLYSGMTIHTLDMFFIAEVAPDAVPHPADDAAELFWIPITDVNPKDFGLRSISQAVDRFISR